MSLSIDGFWKAGFWTQTFWADGFWFEGAPVTPPVDTPQGAGNWNNRKRFVYKLSKHAKEVVEDVAQLGLEPKYAETALRIKLQERDVAWNENFLEAETTLQRAIAAKVANNIQELKKLNEEMLLAAEMRLQQAIEHEAMRINMMRENNNRIAVLMMLN